MPCHFFGEVDRIQNVGRKQRSQDYPTGGSKVAQRFKVDVVGYPRSSLRRDEVLRRGESENGTHAATTTCNALEMPDRNLLSANELR